MIFAGFGCLIAMNAAVQRSEGLAVTLLFGFGLLIGVSTAPTLSYYASADPQAVWQAGAATALFIAGFGAAGYSTRRDLLSPRPHPLLGPDRADPVRHRDDLCPDPQRCADLFGPRPSHLRRLDGEHDLGEALKRAREADPEEDQVGPLGQRRCRARSRRFCDRPHSPAARVASSVQNPCPKSTSRNLRGPEVVRRSVSSQTMSPTTDPPGRAAWDRRSATSLGDRDDGGAWTKPRRTGPGPSLA